LGSVQRGDGLKLFVSVAPFPLSQLDLPFSIVSQLMSTELVYSFDFLTLLPQPPGYGDDAIKRPADARTNPLKTLASACDRIRSS
jgi:hypothetical protein